MSNQDAALTGSMPTMRDLCRAMARGLGVPQRDVDRVAAMPCESVAFSLMIGSARFTASHVTGCMSAKRKEALCFLKNMPRIGPQRGRGESWRVSATEAAAQVPNASQSHFLGLSA
jgi:hypothetical protein